MKVGLILPTIGVGANRRSLDAGADAARDLGWHSVWVTDHLMVPGGSEADEYGTILEALISLTYVAARYDSLVVGTSAIIPPMRNSVLLAKELATLDELSQGRLIVGVGVADRRDLTEFKNLGVASQMNRRGALVDESIALWRHLWSGDTSPFVGEFHHLEDFSFLPLPPQGGSLPIWTGGRSDRALRRAAEVADGYHAARTSPETLERSLPKLAKLCEQLGRPQPTLSVRARAHFEQRRDDVYTLSGSPANMQRDVERFAELGVELLTVVFDETNPDRISGAAERFQREIMTPVFG